MQDREWTLRSGDTINRSAFQVNQEWGGRSQGGIAPSRKTFNIFIFMKTTAAEEFGYADGWHTDGCLHYTGEGQIGDQTTRGVNRSVLEHAQQPRRELRVFDGSGGTVTYLGHFDLDPVQPYYWTDAPDLNGDIRQVIVFRLRPLDVPPDRIPRRGRDASIVRIRPLENHQVEGYLQAPNTRPIQTAKREAALLDRYNRYLMELGNETTSHYYKPATEPRYLRNDLFNETREQLVEAKGCVTREVVRMLIGQITDYRRFEDDPNVEVAALLPEKPRPDLEALLLAAGIAAVWPKREAFTDNTGGRFT